MTDKTSADRVAQALRDTLESPNEVDSNYETANVVDGLFAIARAINRLATAAQSVASAMALTADIDEPEDQ